ncbi:MAG: hypothetical protein A3F11_10995 [Gammaproteobacteria bacterium RIFCSPHIGHO2_12_FULL_37_14]|nr:MAG: hypothetical protein A3F11_10995 [Gammaproteobacteria bacterium RIFCSPHIGHO2_12_FULL_37_14]
MKQNTFYSLGKLIYRLRFAILILTIILVVLCIPFVPKALSHFSETGFTDPSSESAKADKFLKDSLNYQHNRFIVLYKSNSSFDSHPNLYKEIHYSLERINKLPTLIIYPDDNKQQVSKDGHTAYAIVALKGNQDLTEKELTNFKNTIKKPPNLKMLIGGQPIFMEATKAQTQKDLIKAEYIATPIAVITLLAVFGSVVAAIVPMILDGICAVFILGILFCVGDHINLSVFTLNIALLLGLCLSLDYALFIISRFRDEISQENNVEEALAITLATAGKAVFFSGLAVLISLAALLLFPINILFSVGVGGITAVSIAVLISIIVLPAILAILKQHINFISLRFSKNNNHSESRVWKSIINNVVSRPWAYLIFIFILLLFLGLPFLTVELGISDYHILPKKLEIRKVFDILTSKFSENQLTPISIIVKADNSPILSKNNISHLYQYTNKLRRDPRVEHIDSIVNSEPQLTRQQYELLYSGNNNRLPDSLKKLLTLTTHKDFTVVTVFSAYPSDAKQTKDLIAKIRKSEINNMTIQVTGTPVNTMDVLDKISAIFPYALSWVIVLTYLILLLLLRSLFLPIKAIIVNVLSLFASYGVLVFIIQDGHLSHLLHFQAQGLIDISLIIIIFCALFGFSMDYEVFLLSRIKERYEQTGNTNRSICYGIIHSSKIITSAAMIVIFICFSFIAADILMVKAFGLGIAIAIFIDAFLLRTLFVPAFMAILGKWNWYLPKWLDNILPRISFNPKDKHED